MAVGCRRLRASLLLPQDRDELLFREPACLHVHPLQGDGLHPFPEEVPGLRSAVRGHDAAGDAARCWTAGRPTCRGKVHG